MAGIKYLQNDDLKSIKFITIKDAIRKFINTKDDFKCVSCNGEGAVMTLCVETNMLYALACRCSRGDAFGEANEVVKWNGTDLQPSNGKHLKLLKQKQPFGGVSLDKTATRKDL